MFFIFQYYPGTQVHGIQGGGITARGIGMTPNYWRLNKVVTIKRSWFLINISHQSWSIII